MKIIETWGYHASEQPRIFDLSPGENLPEGWHDSPARIGEPASEPVAAPVAASEPAPRHPLDHDGDGRPGGSLPGPRRRGRPRKAA